MNKEQVQQQIETIKEIYNTNMVAGDGNVKSSEFNIIISIPNVSVNPYTKLSDLKGVGTIQLEEKSNGKKIGITDFAVNPDVEIGAIFFEIRKRLEGMKDVAPVADEVQVNITKKEDNRSEIEDKVSSFDDGEKCEEIEYRKNKYYYFKSDLSKIYKVSNNELLKNSPFKSAILKKIKKTGNVE